MRIPTDAEVVEAVALLETPRRDEAVRVLARAGEVAIGPVLSLANAGDGGTRAAAIEVLGAVGGGDGTADGRLDVVIAGLGDADLFVRFAAVRAIARLKPAARRLVAGLGSADPMLRQATAGALGGLDVKDVVPDLIVAASDPVAGVRGAAVTALGAHALDVVARALVDGDVVVRRAAVGVCRVKGLTPLALRACAGDPDSQVRQYACDALARDPGAGPELVAAFEAGESAAGRSLVALGHPAGERYIAALEARAAAPHDPSVRPGEMDDVDAAVEMLVRFGRR